MGSKKFGIEEVSGFTVEDESGNILMESNDVDYAIPTVTTAKPDLLKMRLSNSDGFDVDIFVDEENYIKILKYSEKLKITKI